MFCINYTNYNQTHKNAGVIDRGANFNAIKMKMQHIVEKITLDVCCKNDTVQPLVPASSNHSYFFQN
jgi:hypothetical protein